MYAASKLELQRGSGGNWSRHSQETQHFPTPSYKGQMWGWDHLSLPFFHFLFAFCLIFVTPWSLSQFFPGKTFCHILMDIYWQPGFWHLYPVLVSATQIKTLWIYVTYTQTHVQVCVCAHGFAPKQTEWGRPYGSFSCSFYPIHSKNKGWDSAFPIQSSESWASHLILLEAGEATSGE